jgi:putative ABC transport system permease protein
MQTYLIRSFFEQIGGLVLVSAAILTGFAVIIAVGVVYNSARISLQERAWELATLRVLGFTRGEISTILFSEFTIEIALGVPLGMALSQGLVELIAHYWSTEMFQIPATIGTRSYASAAVVVVAAAAASAYFVRRQIDRLDLVAVLKTRDWSCKSDGAAFFGFLPPLWRPPASPGHSCHSRFQSRPRR